MEKKVLVSKNDRQDRSCKLLDFVLPKSIKW